MAVIIDDGRTGSYNQQQESPGAYFSASVLVPAHVGMVVGEAAAGVYPKASSPTAAIKHARGVCITNSETALDEVDISRHCVIGPYVDSSGNLVGTQGAKVYVDEAVDGEVLETRPPTAGSSINIVGHVVKPGYIEFDIPYPHVADAIGAGAGGELLALATVPAHLAATATERTPLYVDVVARTITKVEVLPSTAVSGADTNTTHLNLAEGDTEVDAYDLTSGNDLTAHTEYDFGLTAFVLEAGNVLNLQHEKVGNGLLVPALILKVYGY